MGHRAGETVEPDHHQGLAAGDIAQQQVQHGPGGIGAGGVFLKNNGASGCGQFIALRIGALLVRRYPRVANLARPGMQE